MQEINELLNLHDDNMLGFVIKIVVSVFIAAIGFFLIKGFKKLLCKTTGMTKLDDSARSILRYVVKYAIVIVCVIMILNIFGVNTTSLLAVLGAAGIAIGLALKNTLGNIASGIILVFLRNYRIGEFIEFGLISGTVKEISLFTTILETQDGIYISAPNSCIWGVPLRNHTRNGKRRMEITAKISCKDSIDSAIQILKDISMSESRFLKNPEPKIIVLSAQDKFVNLAIRAWASNDDYWDVYWQQLRNVKEKMDEAGILI